MLSQFHTTGWKLHHVAHAVYEITAGISFYEKQFGFPLVAREHLVEHQVEVAFFDIGGSFIELIAPLGESVRLRKFLEKRGETCHHVCFAVDFLEDELHKLEAKGIELIDKMPRRGALGHSIAFLNPKSTKGLLIELCNKME